ncbi:MAG: class I SAM-dependent methyltransferase family protein [Halobacteriales archaeon]|nr:class I SAM-dependent methyltransferase family protein [Halobacteriales archaeon]
MTVPALAAVVPKPEADRAIAALRSEGVYDDGRSVVEAGDGTVELPVTAAPTETAVLDVVEQVEPVPRQRGLEDRLRERGWTDAELERAPGSWSVVGDAVLVRFPADCPDREAVAEALLELQGADTVLAEGDVSGPTREPDVEVVAGSGDTEVVHVEHGTRYALDLAEVMFSPGNQAERVRMGEVVEPGERVLDAFAGIGYFALPMARAGAEVTAVEVNPAAFGYLVENAALNGVTDRLSATLGDCRAVVGPDGPGAAAPGAADRLVLGHFEAADALEALLPALRPGGTVHLHAAAPETGEGADEPVEALDAAASSLGRSASVEDRREVKSYAPGVAHVVVDATVD